MMLQQTQVVTATPYWLRWIERFPSVASLADAPLDDVLMHWQGLGYYARARNMHKAAAVVLTEHSGVFPTSYDELLALPGVGPYTAAAVSSISSDAHHAVVDANVIRVLCRHEGIEEILSCQRYKCDYKPSRMLISTKCAQATSIRR